jgi:hypothetical protein
MIILGFVHAQLGFYKFSELRLSFSKGSNQLTGGFETASKRGGQNGQGIKALGNIAR